MIKLQRQKLTDPSGSPVLRSLLLDRGSLTRRLIALSHGQFRVRVDSMRWSMPLPWEARLIRARDRETVLTREVTLLCNDRPTVFARSLLPRRTLRGRFRALRHLGTRPLGELLFTDPAVRRGHTFFFTVQNGAPLHSGASERITTARNEFWARASLFYIGNDPLLVTEIFLTDGE